jgi:hypothetical protein
MSTIKNIGKPRKKNKLPKNTDKKDEPLAYFALNTAEIIPRELDKISVPTK